MSQLPPENDWHPTIQSGNDQAAYACERIDHNYADMPWVMCRPFLVDIVATPKDGLVTVYVVEDDTYGGGYCEFRVKAITPVGKIAKALMKL